MGEKSYVVEGAELCCMNGSRETPLHITVGYNYTEDGKKKASIQDCKAGINIQHFGYCRIEHNELCKDHMRLNKQWEFPGIAASAEQVCNEPALTKDSVLICKNGGFIVPVTSGQGQGQSIDWSSYWERYSSRLDSWARYKCERVWVFDPIDANTGNFVYEKEDLVIGGITKLSFHMTYYSMGENLGGSIGEGWHHNHEIYIEPKAAGILCLHLGDGEMYLCRKTVGDIYEVAGATGLLKKETDGYRYVSGTGLEYSFDKDGRIAERKDRNGNTDTFLHNMSGQLIEVRGANGGILHYEYNKEGNLYRVYDYTGREVRLCYSYRVLCKFINSSGQEYTYQYNENLRLESITTPRGIVVVKNVYDSANRVVKQITPDGGVVELRYDDKDMCTYSKNQDGFITSYECDDKFRNIRTIYQGSEERFEYNANNQRTLYVDRNGNQTRYFYDEQGRINGVINALGVRNDFVYHKNGKLLSYAIDGKNVLENTYDKDGRLIKTTDALGRSRETAYNAKGQPERMIMPDGSEIKIAYDDRGNVQNVTDAYGVKTEYAYDALNRLIEITDGEGNQVSYQYDERNHLLSETNPEGSVRKYTYDVSGRPVQVEDFDGGIVAFSYNAMGKPEVMTDKEGRKTKRSYNLSGKIEKEVSPLGRTTVYQYDRDGRLIQLKNMASEQEEESKNVTDLVYDPVGNLMNVKVGDGQEVMSETFYEYDALNRVITAIDPVGGKTAYTYDKRIGKVSSITDAAGNRKTFRYNDAGELIEETDIRGNTTRYQYNELGKLTEIIDAAGRVTRHHYLPGGRLEKSVYPDGRKMLYKYDTLGRVHQKTDGQGYSLSYEYDSMGRILCIVSSTGQKKSYVYDAVGNVIAVTDAGGNITKYSYTLSGKLKEVIDALGNRTEYAYDAEDRLIYIRQYGVEGEADRITEYERDVFGQIVCIRNALGEESYRYDALSRLIEKTDNEGFVASYTYTPDGKAESVLYNDGRRAEFTYTPLRQLAMIKDWLGETRIDRNRQGMPIDITDHKGRSIHYEWGDLGERRKIVYSDGTTLRWKYDEMLRPVELARVAGGEEILHINYRYDEHGRLSEKRNSGGYHTYWNYNELGQLDELTHKGKSGILDSFHYSYDAMGNKTMVRKERRGLPEESGEYCYAYDALQRLINVEKDGKKLRSYQYDSFGNRTCMEDYAEDMRYVYTYDSMNKMLEKKTSHISESGEASIHTTYAYDGRGNLTGEYRDGRLLHGYAYNTANRLEKSWDDKGGEAAYFYNALGHRTGRRSETETEDYLLDLTKPYYNLLGIENDDGMQKFFWDSNVAVMEDERKKLHYYMQDDLGSPLRVLYGNGNGDVYGYDEFGRDFNEPEEITASRRRYSRQGEKQPFGYTGYRYDSISHTYFAQAREYQPEHGRFMAVDIKSGRVAAPKTRNRYGYCWNNPVRMVDLDGKEPMDFYPYYMKPDLIKDIEKNLSEMELPEAGRTDVTYGGLLKSEEEVSSNEDFFNLQRNMENEVPQENESSSILSDFLGNEYESIGSKSNISTDVPKKNNEVYILNYTSTLGAIVYGSWGMQVVFDREFNFDIQLFFGGGIMTALEGSRTISGGRLRVPSVEDAKGLGFDTGVGGGKIVVGGLNLISAYDDDGYIIGDGEMVYFGLGLKVPTVESHMGFSYAISLIEIFEKIFNMSKE